MFSQAFVWSSSSSPYPVLLTRINSPVDRTPGIFFLPSPQPVSWLHRPPNGNSLSYSTHSFIISPNITSSQWSLTVSLYYSFHTRGNKSLKKSESLLRCGEKCALPTDLSSLLENPVHGAADLSEHCSEEGAPCQDTVWCFAQQPGLDLLWPHTHSRRIKVWRVLSQPLLCQPGQSMRGDHVRCCVQGRRHSEM